LPRAELQRLRTFDQLPTLSLRIPADLVTDSGVREQTGRRWYRLTTVPFVAELGR